MLCLKGAERTKCNSYIHSSDHEIFARIVVEHINGPPTHSISFLFHMLKLLKGYIVGAVQNRAGNNLNKFPIEIIVKCLHVKFLQFLG